MPGLSQPPPPTDAPVVDTAEQVYISSLALLKMLKHGRAGVPMEVMGLMLGKEHHFILTSVKNNTQLFKVNSLTITPFK